MIIQNDLINDTRRINSCALRDTLAAAHAANTTEKEFCDIWTKNLGEHDNIIGSWYDPPNGGMACLAGPAKFNSRVTFKSLRGSENLPSDTRIDTNNGMVYVYSSPVGAQGTNTRLGDISITKYYGNDDAVKKHLKNSHDAVSEVIELLNHIKTPQELYEKTRQVFALYGLRLYDHNSITDPTGINLGHTFPEIKLTTSVLDEVARKMISGSRKFINAKGGWEFENDQQFTIEPRLVSMRDDNLPLATKHYLVQRRGNDFLVCRDVDNLERSPKLL